MSAESDDMRIGLSMLAADDTRLRDRAFTTSVADAFGLWLTKLLVTRFTGAHLFGVLDLLARLRSMNQTDTLEFISIKGADASGVLFFLEGMHEFVGLVAVDQRGRPHRTLHPDGTITDEPSRGSESLP